MSRLVIAFACLFLLASCARTQSLSPQARLRDFIEDAKASGLVARSIEKNGVRGVSVAPPPASALQIGGGM